MSEKPIIFSTPMVKAILEGRKTQTRRVIEPQPRYQLKEYKDSKWHEYSDEPLADPRTGSPWGRSYHNKYQAGDTLWVRETWSYGCEIDKSLCVDCGECDGTLGKFMYKANNEQGKLSLEGQREIKWRSPIYMPRAAARIFLEAVSVRVEQLRQISCEDKIAEGFNSCSRAYPCDSLGICNNNCFMKAWDSLNAKRGYLWDSNPWVWVIEFRRTQEI